VSDLYIDIDHWPSHFKISLSIIIPKPNKTSYNLLKDFEPILLLNMLVKLKKSFAKDFNFNELHIPELVRRTETMFDYRYGSISYLSNLFRIG